MRNFSQDQANPKIVAEIAEKTICTLKNKKATQFESGWLKAYYITQEIKLLYDFIKRECAAPSSDES